MKHKNKSIDQILDYIVAYLKDTELAFTSKNSDGRVNSSENEREFIENLTSNNEFNIFLRNNNLKIIHSKIREWYDVAIENNNNNEFYPINIKITDLNKMQNDNLNSKLGIYYSLTGKIPNFSNEIQWEKFFKELHENFNQTDADYYFLVINKNNTKDVFWNSLKKLNSLTPNGNNLPFQCEWNKNRNKIDRDYESAKDFLIKCFGDSIKKRVKIFDDFNKYFNQ